MQLWTSDPEWEVFNLGGVEELYTTYTRSYLITCAHTHIHVCFVSHKNNPNKYSGYVIAARYALA